MEKAGAQSLEACMASSITQARDGTLYLMCGGKPEAFERAKPILEKLSASLRYIGAAGTARAGKEALVNMVMNINTRRAGRKAWELGTAAPGARFDHIARSLFPRPRRQLRACCRPMHMPEDMQKARP